MHSFLVILCISTVLLYGVTCQLSPRSLLHRVTGASMAHKRQDVKTPLECALERFDAIYQGNTSRVVTDCRAVAMLEDDVSPNSDQSTVNAVFRTLCIPDCGNVLLDAYDACGAFISPHERNLLSSLCGLNRNGNFCYEYLIATEAFLTSAAICSIDHDTVECNCPAISQGVEERGCCIGIVHDVLEMLKALNFIGDINLNAVYNECNIDVPDTECNNSPLTASSSLAQASYNIIISAVAIALAVLVKVF